VGTRIVLKGAAKQTQSASRASPWTAREWARRAAEAALPARTSTQYNLGCFCARNRAHRGHRTPCRIRRMWPHSPAKFSVRGLRSVGVCGLLPEATLTVFRPPSLARARAPSIRADSGQFPPIASAQRCLAHALLSGRRPPEPCRPVFTVSRTRRDGMATEPARFGASPPQ
jgi:hypothetical protein